MNTLKIENPTYAFTTAFVDELARAGIKDAVICPGSRSTPLAYTFAANDEIKVWMQYDERAAGFFALGMAKAAKRPVILVCTSGTAAANFFPAVVEAKMSRVPLIVLTADRPAELRDNGAPQAIDQIGIYGSYAKWFVEMALPEASNEMLRYARTAAGRAAGTALATPAGVIHLNMPFREPLTPAPIAGLNLPDEAQRDPVAWYGRPDAQPYVAAKSYPRTLHNAAVENLMGQLLNYKRGLIIAGPEETANYSAELSQLAQALGYPILADPLSQLRCGSHSLEPVIANYDAFLRDSRFTTGEEFTPQIVLRFGAMPTAKPLLLFLKRFPDLPQIVIDGGDGWNEPTLLAGQVIHAAPLNVCQSLLTQLNAQKEISRDRQWMQSWQRVAQATASALHDTMENLEEPFEGRVLASLPELLPDGATLYVGNSMPVRDLDSFFAGSPKSIRVLGNRGANGIDGLISSALGAATQSEPLVLVLGDLSAYHDLNGLLAAKLHNLNATIIILNNDGGGIFSFLPQAQVKEPARFEELFGTPHGLDFEPVVKMYGGDFRRTTTHQEFCATLGQVLEQPGLKVIEIPTNRARNVVLHREMWAAVYARLAQQEVLV